MLSLGKVIIFSLNVSPLENVDIDYFVILL